MVKERKRWIFTLARRNTLKKAQKEHVRLVRLGKRARARGIR
jgi:hypothetical protein